MSDEIEHPDWLPEGWKVVVKFGGFGSKAKYYTDPTNGRQFNSKPEVLRYLNGEVHVPKKRIKAKRSNMKRDKASTETEGQSLIENKEDNAFIEGDACKSGSKVDAPINVDKPEANNNGEETSTGAELCVNKKRKEHMSNLPRRTSKRLARSVVNLPNEAETSKEAGVAASLSGETEARCLDEPESKCIMLNPTSNEQKEHVIQKGAEIKENKKNEKQPDLSVKPCTDVALKTRPGDFQMEDVNKIGDIPCLGEILAVPCYWFAIKTLISDDLPINYTSLVQSSSQQPLNDPNKRQQGVPIPPLHQTVHVNSQKSVDKGRKKRT